MPKVVAIARNQIRLNLDLTGVHVEHISDVRAVEKRCTELFESDTKVLILEETYRDEFSEVFQENLKRHQGEPLIVFCPSFDEEDSDVDAYLSSVIRPAIGFEIRLE